MTLRVSLEIVPFGNEENTYPIYRMNIHNQGCFRDLGFGHTLCSYKIKLEKYRNETEQRLLGCEEWEVEKEVIVPEHDRRDGPLSLVKKALEALDIS